MTTPKNPAFGQTVKQSDLDTLFLTGPGEELVANTLLQMSKVAGFVSLFGPHKPGKDSQRWADYQKFDWTTRQLPAINVFEAEGEDKDSDNAYLRGTIQIQVFWPGSMRRSDLTRVPSAFKGVVQNFFSSDFVKAMLDEHFSITRPEKVNGLNEYGKSLLWTPDVEGMVEDELVPVTIIGVRYRIDLRAWYRAMEFMGRTKGDPFSISLAPLTQITGEYDGVPGTDGTDIRVVVPDQIAVNT